MTIYFPTEGVKYGYSNLEIMENTWFDFISSNFFDDFRANEEQFNATIKKVLFSIDKIIEKE